MTKHQDIRCHYRIPITFLKDVILKLIQIHRNLFRIDIVRFLVIECYAMLFK